uniref:LRR receptor-like serine/threonine-protein kinase RGI3 n=1 Tax=Erigeron canadensis TaxID=72917 RepID=UPI001CB9D6A1|nr:LRR receptor-like serine/threonine-protein kinase RGI3 [Erigeron canadensis]
MLLRSFFFTFLFTIFFYCPHICDSIDSQGEALLAWKNTFNNTSQSTASLKSWNILDPNPCTWFGIHCNSQMQVVSIKLKSLDLRGNLPSNLQPLKNLNSLILSSTNLTGAIPAEFGDYLELNVIDISNNSISGIIPSEICKLVKLQTLNLNSNFIEGEIPVDIARLSSLRNLIIYDNQLSGSIPKSIGEMRNLEVIRAGGNRNLGGELPVEIGKCSNLVVLGLAETSISGSIPVSIGNLKRIQTIAIYTSQMSGKIPDEIGNCSELMNLYLHQNNITGSIPRSIGQLKKLESALLWQNGLVGTIPEEFGNCTELKTIDLSENSLTGSIPVSFGRLLKLRELQLSVNKLSGNIPPEISNCTHLTHLELDNNQLSGEIPIMIGKLQSMTLFFTWQNNLTGNIPESLSQCQHLQALDLSNNHFSGTIPKEIFSLKNLRKLLLLSNDLYGSIPPDIGNCTNLYRFRVSGNRLSGSIPSEIGYLKSLTFLDLGSNRFDGSIPRSISGCGNLQFFDLHSNGITGVIPDTLPISLQLIDMSSNRLTGSLTSSVGTLTELTKLNVGNNQLSGDIPGEIISCTKLQFLDIGNNGFSGVLPKQIGQIPSLGISLNLSCNQFIGEIPPEFIGLTKLTTLDLSHNKLNGRLDVLKNLQNLVCLNVSFNDFTGQLPDTSFFHNLPPASTAGNPALYISSEVNTQKGPAGHTRSAAKLAMLILVSIGAVLVLLGTYMLVRAHLASTKHDHETWEMTFYQKMDVSVNDIVRNLTNSNIIGTGSSGVVYRVTTMNGETLAVKKMWSTEQSGAFRSEIQTLSSIRHKNIIRLLGWGSNQTIKILFYDYYPNGSLSSLLHGAGKGAQWETRFDILLGVAHALAYLHHDCMPAIMHGDVKGMNVLLGPNLQPYLADFGLARVVTDYDKGLSKQIQRPQLAGSYGYMAPEHASAQQITEKTDVYSYGVLLLEVLTGRHPLDPTLPGGAHLVQWVRDHLHNKREPVDILDSRLKGRADPQMHEMLQMLAVSFLCVSTHPDDRPIMKDVVAMLKEIHHEDSVRSDLELKQGPLVHKPTPPSTRTMALQGLSNHSYTFPDDSV